MSYLYIKCDICGNFTDAWFEPNSLCDYQENGSRREKKVEHICLKCKDEINEVIGNYLRDKKED